MCKVARLEAALPLLPVEVSHRHHLQWRAGVYAVNGHRHAVRVAARPVVAADAASPARAGVRRGTSSRANWREATLPPVDTFAPGRAAAGRVATPPLSSLHVQQHATSARTERP